MSKRVCVCGTEHGKEKPLVITITTCKSKHPHPEVNKTKSNSKRNDSKPVATSSPINLNEDIQKSQLNTSTNETGNKDEDEETIDHLLICEEEDVEIPPHSSYKGYGEPVDTSVLCDLDGTEETNDELFYSINKTAVEENGKTREGSKTTEKKIQTPKSVKAAKRCPLMYVDCDCHEESIQCDLEQLNQGEVDKIFSDLNKSKVEETKQKDKIEKAKPVKESNVEEKYSEQYLLATEVQPSTPMVKDKASNVPSVVAHVMLPILVPRYHGPGCAMEVNVLEKHETNCRYRKLANSERNPLDDRSGSYEIIGRIMFKTCHPDSILHENNVINSKSGEKENSKVATIYSLFNIPYDYMELDNTHLTPDISDRQIQAIKKYLRHQRILESLAKSTKSFPNNLNKYISLSDKLNEDDSHKHNIWNQHCEHRHGYHVPSSDVEELFFSNRKSEKSIQITEDFGTKKKWYYYLFPCIFLDNSYTAIVDSESEFNYKDKRYIV